MLEGSNIPNHFSCFCLFVFQDGQLDFIEFVAAVNLIFRGKLIDKLKWSFKVYDTDGNGSLTRQEVKHIISVSIRIILLIF